MNLAERTAWPPAELSHIFRPIDIWSAWYEGDPDKLHSLYSGVGAVAPRPSQYSNGLVGRIARWFWGQPVPAGQSRPKLHMPVASDIATASADMLFGEELQIAAPEGMKLDRLQEILDGNQWQSLLLEAGEVSAALTGVYLRLGWDTAVAGHPLISVVHADHAIPTFTWGRLTEVTFWQEVKRDAASVWRHFETHTPGVIEHRLYQGTATNLGTVVPLADASATADLQLDDQDTIRTGIDQLTAAFIPNIRPNRRWRNDPLGRNLGRSDFDGIEPLFDAVDETWSSWMRDLRLGKARILVAQAALQTMGPGQGAAFDLDQELFTSLNLPLDGQQPLITPKQFDIRVEAHQGTLHELLAAAYQSAGYSPATFGLQDQVATTATEVAARQRRTMTTREKKTRYWTAALEPFLEAVTAVDRSVFGKGEVFRPTVSFPAAVSPTIGELAQSAQLLASAQAASIDTRVRMVHPDWTDDQVEAEVALIMAEGSMATQVVGLDPAMLDATQP